MYLVYLASADYDRTNNIIKDLEMLIGKEDIDTNYLILGNFNAHLGFLGPQKLNREGKLVLSMILKLNLVILNCDLLCKGEITWSSRGQKSSIDFILASTNMQQKLTCMKIDESKEEYDLSDHNLITAIFEFRKVGKRESKTNARKEKWFYSTIANDLKFFGENVRRKIIESNVDTIGELSKIITVEADSKFKKRLKTYLFGESYDMNQKTINEQYKV